MIKSSRGIVGKYTVLKLEGKLLQKEAMPLREILDAALEDGKTWIALDLSMISHACSLAVGVIAKFSKKVKERDGRMVILRPRHGMRTLLEHTKLIDVMPVVESEKGLE